MVCGTRSGAHRAAASVQSTPLRRVCCTVHAALAQGAGTGTLEVSHINIFYLAILLVKGTLSFKLFADHYLCTLQQGTWWVSRQIILYLVQLHTFCLYPQQTSHYFWDNTIVIHFVPYGWVANVLYIFLQRTRQVAVFCPGFENVNTFQAILSHCEF